MTSTTSTIVFEPAPRPAAVRPATARPGTARPGAARPSGVRLTRRGRVVLLVLVLALGVVALVVGAASVSATTSAERGPVATVVVQPGQTLWGVAEQVAPDRDPREVVHAIVEVNDLPGSVVAPGQSLAIPSM